MRFFISAILALSLPACMAQEPLVRVKITTDLPQASRILLMKDFTRLERSLIREKHSEATKIFGVPLLDQEVLVQWLNTRVKFLVSDQFLSIDDVQGGAVPEHLTILSNNQVYENSSTLPDALVQASQARRGSVSLGENLGIGLYVLGKFTTTLWGVRVPDTEEFLPISTPRAGLLAMGQSLFNDWLNENIRFQDKALEGGLDSLLASEYRLGVLFHEARHSDGNGKSLGFLHATCPPGHDYAGQVACDGSLNGAYSVGGQYLKLLARDCGDCSEKEREVLRLFALDSFSRVLSVRRKRVSEEETLRRCGDLLRGHQPLPSSCYYNETPAEYWDATPEKALKE